MSRTLSRRLRQALTLAGVLSAGCTAPAHDAARALVLEQLSPPSEQPASAPRLATSGNRAVLSWLEQSDVGRSLRFAERLGGGWSDPRLIATGANLLDNSADVPSLHILESSRLAAQWLERTGPGLEAYSLFLAFSDDDGTTWSGPVRPHHDETATQHGFASFFQLPDDGLGVVWLDGRAIDPDGSESEGGDMGLWTAAFDRNALQTAEAALDERVCDCCQTSSAVTTSGTVLIAYRDRSPREVRDIVVTRFENGEWAPPTPVHEDNWTISGCPVNGPAIDASGENVVVGWFTGATGFGQLFVAFSHDGGRTFLDPIQVDDGRPRGRVSVVIDSEGAFVSWTEALAGRSEFRVRRVSTDGDRGDSVTVGEVTSAQYPRMAALDDELLFAWLALENGSTQLRTARATRVR